MKKFLTCIFVGVVCFLLTSCSSKITLEDLEGYWKLPDDKIFFVEDGRSYVFKDSEESSLSYSEQNGVITLDEIKLEISGTNKDQKWVYDGKEINVEEMTKADYALHVGRLEKQQKTDMLEKLDLSKINDRKELKEKYDDLIDYLDDDLKREFLLRDIKLYEDYLIGGIENNEYFNRLYDYKNNHDTLMESDYNFSFNSKDYNIHSSDYKKIYYLKLFMDTVDVDGKESIGAYYKVADIDPQYDFGSDKLNTKIRNECIGIMKTAENWQQQYNLMNKEDSKFTNKFVAYNKVQETRENLDDYKLDQQVQESIKKDSLKPYRPEVGMTAEEARKTKWGSPKKINYREYASGTQEQWVYDLNRYVYVENGIVTSVTH